MDTVVEEYDVFYVALLAEANEFGDVEVWCKGINRFDGVLPDLFSTHVGGQVEAEHVLTKQIEGAHENRGLVSVQMAR